MPPGRRIERLPLLAVAGLLLLGFLGSAACAAGRAGEEEEEAAAEARTLRVQVRNRNFDAVTIFGETPGGRVRLGTVGSNSGRAFSIRWTSPDDIRFLLRLESGLSCRSRTRYVEPGETVTLTVASDFARSPVCRGG